MTFRLTSVIKRRVCAHNEIDIPPFIPVAREYWLLYISVKDHLVTTRIESTLAAIGWMRVYSKRRPFHQVLVDPSASDFVAYQLPTTSHEHNAS